ncbi:MAG TPA: VanZ family protein [Nitrospiraceae bacterium]|jgi:VanZ family protein|nr:VanZ family protein [Nitrospiraceae bacterium]
MRDAVRQQDVTVQMLWYWMPVVLYAGVIFFLSAQSHPEEQLPSFLFEGVSDKVLHAVEYGILSLLCYRAFRWAAGSAVARQAVVLAIVTASVFGLTDEVHQLFVPFRESSWLDWLADTVGAVIGALSWRFLRSK